MELFSRRWLVPVLASAWLLAACGTATPVYERTARPVPARYVAAPTLTVPGPGKQEVIVKRDRGLDQAFAMRAHVYVDDRRVADLGNGELLKLYLPPGEYRFGVQVRGGGNAGEGVLDVPATIQQQPWPMVFRIFWVDHDFKAGQYTGFVIRRSPV